MGGFGAGALNSCSSFTVAAQSAVRDADSSCSSDMAGTGFSGVVYSYIYI